MIIKHSKRIKLYQHYIWTVHELYMNLTWTVLELYLNCTWTINEPYMNNTWTVPVFLVQLINSFKGGLSNVFRKDSLFLKTLSYAPIFEENWFFLLFCVQHFWIFIIACTVLFSVRTSCTVLYYVVHIYCTTIRYIQYYGVCNY